MNARPAILVASLRLFAPPAWGQVVRGHAKEAESGRAIESGVVTLLDADGA